MKRAIIFICVVGFIPSETEAGKAIESHEEWVSEVGPPSLEPRACSECTCSMKSTRIVGGELAPDQKHKWMVNIMSKTAKGDAWCGGTLINDRYVLTAAHCIASAAKDITLTFGTVDVSNTKDAVKRKGVQVIVHKDYNPKRITNDIALIKIDPIDLSVPGRVGTVCMATECADYEGEDGVILGWGKTAGKGQVTKQLRLLNFKIPAISECKKKFGGYFNGDKQVCCGTINGAKGTCGGDSGGPMLIQHKTLKYYKQVGLDSFGAKECRSYSVFTKTCVFKDWIAENTKDACKCKDPTS